MSVQAAMLFISRVREDEKLAKVVEALGPEATLAQLSEAGAASGFAFSEAEMRAAYARDWSMRTIRYARKESQAM